MNIEQNYIVNDKTIAIVPAKQIEFDSIVVESEGVHYIRQTPQQIIEASCIHNWSDYEGRRNAVIHHTGFKEKVPIPIHPNKGIVAFPTHAIKHIDCCWLIPQHILRIDTLKDDPKYKTIVTFTNRKSLRLDVSIRSLKSQSERAFEVKYRVEKDLR